MARSHAERVGAYDVVSAALAALDDAELAHLVDDAVMLGSSIGGTAVLLDVAGVPVFAKRVPLTDLERRPGNVMSTANLFELPTFYQYGVGSAGFGVWRELAAHVMTTAWVLGNACDGFPMLYHWREVEAPRGVSFPEARAELDHVVAYWDGSVAVRARLEAIAAAPASVMLFIEYIPHNLHDWFAVKIANHEIEPACAMVERELIRVASFMRANELVHFDAHFGNILTDGDRLYVGDFGLASSPRFELSDTEWQFVDKHRSYDLCLMLRELVNRVVSAVGDGPAREIAAGLVERHASIARVVNEFHLRLRGSKLTELPVELIEATVSPARGFR